MRENTKTYGVAPSGHPPSVFGTEHEPAKAAAARSNINRAFGDATPEQLHLLEGDLLKTLPAAGIPDGTIDALLLDIWTPMAMPTLRIVLPMLRKGAIIITDNTRAAAEGYKELLEFIRSNENGFGTITLPFSGGFELSVYFGAN